jgi:hypothetical protein
LIIENAQFAQEGSYNVIVADSSGSVTSSIVSLVIGIPYEQWATDHGLTIGQSGPDADPDGDGFENILEYAFGTLPLNLGSLPEPLGITVADGGQSYFAVQYQRNTRAVGLRLEPLAAETLSFSVLLPTVPLEPVDLGGGLQQVTRRLSDPVGATSTAFIHVRMLLP